MWYGIRTIDDRLPDNLGFLLAKATQRFNERLIAGFTRRGFADIKPSYGSVLVPLFAEDDLRVGELAERSLLSKQSMTGLVKACEDAGLVQRRRDPDDGRAFRVRLTRRGNRLRAVADEVLEELDAAVVEQLGRRNQAALVRALKGVIRL